MFGRSFFLDAFQERLLPPSVTTPDSSDPVQILSFFFPVFHTRSRWPFRFCLLLPGVSSRGAYVRNADHPSPATPAILSRV